jgi:hypothetical protein
MGGSQLSAEGVIFPRPKTRNCFNELTLERAGNTTLSPSPGG